LIENVYPIMKTKGLDIDLSYSVHLNPSKWLQIQQIHIIILKVN